MSALEFNQEYRRWEDMLFAFAMKLTRNREDAKDLLQETALRAYRYRNRFRPGTNFRSWCSVIMRNAFINNYRKNRRNPTVKEPLESFLLLDQQNTTDNYGESQMQMEEYDALFQQIGAIYRVPFLMFYAGYEYREIADCLDIPLGTVKSRIFLARKKLKGLLQERSGSQGRMEETVA